MARRKRSRKLGSTGLMSHGADICAKHYRGRPKEIAACQAAVKGMVKKMIATKPTICKKWCGCP